VSVLTVQRKQDRYTCYFNNAHIALYPPTLNTAITEDYAGVNF